MDGNERGETEVPRNKKTQLGDSVIQLFKERACGIISLRTNTVS
jgi:hypothetical protein